MDGPDASWHWWSVPRPRVAVAELQHWLLLLDTLDADRRSSLCLHSSAALSRWRPQLALWTGIAIPDSGRIESVLGRSAFRARSLAIAWHRAGAILLAHPQHIAVESLTRPPF